MVLGHFSQFFRKIFEGRPSLLMGLKNQNLAESANRTGLKVLSPDRETLTFLTARYFVRVFSARSRVFPVKFRQFHRPSNFARFALHPPKYQLQIVFQKHLYLKPVLSILRVFLLKGQAFHYEFVDFRET